MTDIDVVVAVAPPLLADLMSKRLSLEPDLVVGSTFSTAQQVQHLPSTTSPDVLCLDPRLVSTSVTAFVRQLSANNDPPNLVVVTNPSSELFVPDAIKAGCSCFASTESGGDDLGAAVRDAAAGQPHMDEDMLERFGEQLGSSTRSVTRLTDREHDVLVLASEGLTARASAERIGLSVNTVRQHMQNVLGKLGAHSKVEAVSIAIRHGLIPPRT